MSYLSSLQGLTPAENESYKEVVTELADRADISQFEAAELLIHLSVAMARIVAEGRPLRLPPFGTIMPRTSRKRVPIEEQAVFLGYIPDHCVRVAVRRQMRPKESYNNDFKTRSNAIKHCAPGATKADDPIGHTRDTYLQRIRLQTKKRKTHVGR